MKTEEKETSKARVASVSVRFRSKERRSRVKDRAAKTENSRRSSSLLRNHTKTLATQGKTNKGELHLLIARDLDYQIHR